MANLSETYRKFIGVGACAISPIDDEDLVMAFPRLSALTLADNIELGKAMANTETGVSSVFNTYVTSHQPELSLTYSTFNIEMQAIATGWSTYNASVDAPFVRQVIVPEFITGDYTFQAYKVLTGTSGSHTLGSVDARITTQVNGVSTPVSGVTVSNNGEVTVPQSLAGVALTIEVMGTYAGGAITVAKPLGLCQITAGIVTSDNRNVFLYVPSAKINPTGNTFDPSADNKEIKFDILSTGGCEPYRLIEMPLGVECELPEP